MYKFGAYLSHPHLANLKTPDKRSCWLRMALIVYALPDDIKSVWRLSWSDFRLPRSSVWDHGDKFSMPSGRVPRKSNASVSRYVSVRRSYVQNENFDTIITRWFDRPP